MSWIASARPTNERLIAEIKKLRAHFRENQARFGMRIDISPRAVASYEMGEQRPCVHVLARMAKLASEIPEMRVTQVFLQNEIMRDLEINDIAFMMPMSIKAKKARAVYLEEKNIA